MASGSGSQQTNPFPIRSPRPARRTSPYPPSLGSHGRNSPVPPGPTFTAVDPAGIKSAQTASNTPLQRKLATLKTVLKTAKVSLKALPPVRSALDGLEECLAQMQIREQTRHEYEEIVADLTSLANLIQAHVIEKNPFYAPCSIINITRAIEEQTRFIKDRQDQSRINQLIMAENDAEAVLKCYRRIGALFQRLQTDISLSVWDVLCEQQMDTLLERLLPAYDAYHNAALPTSATKRAGCTEGTRVDLLEATQAWTRQEDAPKIYWLNGMAGTGKTTIAYTLCEMLEEYKQLGASFFCSRNSPDCRDVNRIVPTIAYQLGRYSNPYRKALCDVLRNDPDGAKRNTEKQFETLISKPLAATGKAMPTDVVVVIDALDECADVDGTRNILNILLRSADSLPIKFYVSSRPEPTISGSMMTSRNGMPSILRLHDIEKSLVQADIKLYLTEALASADITPAEISQLAEQSGSLFIFAATAVRYIVPAKGPVNHKQRLRVVLGLHRSRGNKSHKDIDELYATILSNALDAETFEDDELVPRQQVLWTVVCAREPLTIFALAEVLHPLDAEAVRCAIVPLQSVLHISETTSVVSTLHASFPDFLLSKERSGLLFCDEMSHDSYLAECCFRIMERSLRFNICDLESSYEFDGDIPGLKDRVDRKISAGLFYSCRYWSNHLARNSASPRLLSLLQSLLEHRLLFWMEVLHLKRTIGHGETMLSEALAWLPTQDESTRLRDFTYDARNFLTTFAGNPTSLSTPHIYTSVLPFTSKQSLVYLAYWPRTQGLIRIEGAAMDTRSNPALASWPVAHGVSCLALSNDGKRVASGSRGIEVSVWDVSSGTRILGPLEGHEDQISSVAYSPDDTCIASGSSDYTVCIWDARKGNLTAGPLHGHTAQVNSVAFSPDGTRLASGSVDQTIRLWDVRSGAPVDEPLEGHQGAVQSIAFSPDGEHLASGSTNCTIRVWDWKKKTMTHVRFEGHTSIVWSIAYSRDGHRLVSGSGDCTIRVWNASNGTLLADPFEGHTDHVSCVSFSPNDTLVVSGSWDRTIRVWDAVSGALVAGPLEGHYAEIASVLFTMDSTRILSGSESDAGTVRVWDVRQETIGATEPLGHVDAISSASLSPDHTRLAAGSYDKTIRVWDMHSGALVAGPFKGHTESVTSVAFSPDGTRIVSGSHDCTVRTWDASTGALLVGPVEGYAGSVHSVAFSPDGSRIASGSFDWTIRLLDSHTGSSVAERLKGHANTVLSIAFSPEGCRIVSGSADKTVRMWDANHGTTLWVSNAHISVVSCVMFSPDGMRVVSGSGDEAALVLDAGDGALLHRLLGGRTRGVSSVAFSPDGTRVVSGSWDRTVRVWDVESGTTVSGPLKSHTSDVHFVVFSLDGMRVISVDGTVRVRDLATVAQANGSNDWHIDKDGWLTNSDSQRLFWVPLDLRDRFELPTSSTPIVIHASCSTRIEPSTLLGDRWRDCWRPPSASS